MACPHGNPPGTGRDCACHDTPSARELLEMWERGVDVQTDLVARVERVLALHARGEAGCCIVCEDDGHVVPWPCPTVRALNGEEP